jgi:hypothetical protein
MRFGWVVLLLLGAGTLRAQPVLDQPLLDSAAVPGLDAVGRGAYAAWLQTNTPRVVAIGSNGRIGWYSGDSTLDPGTTLDAARSRAVAQCTERGGTACRPYAEDLSVVWPGREWRPQPAPGPLVDGMNDAFVPDARFLWHGPEAARGVVVWSHGNGGPDRDDRGLQPPAFLRAFNNAGFDIVRFDRAPRADTLLRAGGWLRDELPVLRRSGYRMVIAAGQSVGAWLSLQMLDTAGLADVVIASSPAAHGSFGSTNLAGQLDDLRSLVEDAQPSHSRVAFIQFSADPFAADPDARARLILRLRPKTAAVLLIDRPPGLSGHLASATAAFNRRFAACLLQFATAQTPATECSGAEEPP